jgi:hypothetical protein
MAWTRQPLIVTALKDLLALQVRVERIKMLQHLQRAEAQARMAGATGDQLKQLQTLRHKLLPENR